MFYAINLGANGAPETAVYNGNTFTLAVGGGEGGDEDETGIEGTYVDADGILSVVISSTTVTFNHTHPMSGFVNTIVYDYTIEDGAVVLSNNGSVVSGMYGIVLEDGVVTVAIYEAWEYEVTEGEIGGEGGEGGEEEGPAGSETNPIVWETIPESVVIDYSEVIGKVYYTFTSDVNGEIFVTRSSENDSWFGIDELNADGSLTSNGTSGFSQNVHSFLVEEGKSYRVYLGAWSEMNKHTITIELKACEHQWSEATCETPSTCANCGATTGDKADHTPGPEATSCDKPQTCTVCGTVLGYIDHSWDEGVVTKQPDCSTETNGAMTLTCTVCGATEERIVWAEHTYVSEEVVPTCTTGGYLKVECSVCDYEYVENYDPMGHQNYEAECGATVACTVCGTEFVKDHFFWRDATCENPAYCGNCEQYVGEPADHNFVDGVCSVCGEPAPVEELKATVDNEFTSDKANNVVILYNKYGAWGVETNGENKNEAGAPVGNIGGLDKADKYVAYEFVLTEAGYVDFVWSVAGSNWNGSGNSGLTDMGNHMTVTIDDEVVNIGGIELLPGEGDLHWWNLQQVVVKDVYLEAGVHTFYCDIAADGYGLNAGAMNIYSTSAVALKNAVVSSVDIIEKDGKIYYAFTMNIVGYTVDDLRIWNGDVDYEISVVEEGENGETIVMVDVSELPIGTKIYPHMSFAGKKYVNNANASGDVRDMGLVVEEQYVQFGDKYFGIISEWSMPTLVVIQAVSAITSADIVEENGSVYYVLTYNVVGYDPATFEFFDGNTVFPVESYSVDGNNVTFKMNITNVSAGTIWPHLRVNGVNWDGDKGDVKVACETETIELNGKTYTLMVQYEMPTVVVATAG